MSAWDPFELSAAPLSAYTPGQGDIAMEGKMETATGAPVYHLEDYLAGNAPYVTGATSKKNPSGQIVYRTIGDNVVPVKITDYGPGVKGIDIASSNSAWAKNFPYQGAKDTTLLSGPTVSPASSSQVVQNYGPPTSNGAYAFGTGSNPVGMSTGADYAAALNRGNAISGIGSALTQMGQSQIAQGASSAAQGSNQALAMLMQRQRSALSQYLPPISGGYYG